MTEYRNSKGTVKTESEIRSENSNTLFPKVWDSDFLNSFGLSPILESAQPNCTAYQTVNRAGVEQDSSGNWVKKWIVVDMFTSTDSKSKSDLEAEYQATLDTARAASVRAKRDTLLSECDWVVTRAKELGQDVPIEWYNYRGDLRQIPEQSGFPNSVTFPSKPS